jgi:hypothetical protein
VQVRECRRGVSVLQGRASCLRLSSSLLLSLSPSLSLESRCLSSCLRFWAGCGSAGPSKSAVEWLFAWLGPSHPLMVSAGFATQAVRVLQCCFENADIIIHAIVQSTVRIVHSTVRHPTAYDIRQPQDN